MADVNLVAWDSAGEVALGDPTDFLVAEIGGSATAVLSGSGRKRKRVRLHAEADCWVVFWSNDADPTVTDGTNSLSLDASNPEYFDMEVGRVLKAATRA